MRKLMAWILIMLMAMACMPVMAEEPVADDIVIDVPLDGGEWWNILLMGGDARDMEKYDRTDSMIILSVNAELGEAKMTSIMRDTWVSIPGKKNNKINAAAYFGGPELAVQTVNENFGMDIENYILINMADMAEIVDLFGGVEVEVSTSEMKVANGYINEAKNGFYNERLDSYDYTPISETGMIHLNGVQAMAYCRDRYTDSDFGRVMRQQEVLLALAEKAKQLEIEDAVEIAGKIGEFVSTNLEPEQIVELAKAVLGIEIENVGQYRIPAEGDYDSGTFSGTWMIRPKLEKVKASLKAFIYGEE